MRRETHSPAMGLRRSSNGGAALGKVLGKKLDGDWVQGVQGALKGGGDDPRRASRGDCGAGAALRGKRIALTALRDPGARRVASRRRGEHCAVGWWARRGRTVHEAAGRAALRFSGQRSSGRKKGKEGEGTDSWGRLVSEGRGTRAGRRGLRGSWAGSVGAGRRARELGRLGRSGVRERAG